MSSSIHPTAEWHAMQDVFYRKHRIYQMQWAELDLARFRVAASSFGGPIALLRDDRLLLEAGPAPLLDSAIHVFSASGQTIGKIEYDGLQHIAGFSWNSREQLVCVQEDGTVRIFSLSGQDPTSFSLGPDASTSILDCRFWDQGLVAMTGDFRFIYVNDIGEPKPKVLADAHITEHPHSWAIVPPHLTLSHHVEVLASVGATVLSIDAVGVQDQLLDHGPYAHISVSPNGRLAALCSDQGGRRIQVVSMDFQRSFSEYSPQGPIFDDHLFDIAWCGSDAAVASFASGETLLLGPFGDTLSFTHDAPMHLVQELDGVRMFNALCHEFLCKVSEDAKSVFQIGSTSAAALLYDALDGIRAHSSRADETVRSIRDDMPQAVDTCIAAAGSEPVPELQQSLLRAASLGKSFLPVFSGDKLVDMCRSLRVVNCLSSYSVGIPVSLLQFQSLPFEEWVARLLNRNQHKLASAVCQYMEQPSDQVYIHWACAKIRASSTLDDDALYRALKDRLDTLPGSGIASYVDIAEVANHCGYQRLAIRLLHHEPRAANQVPLLISMGQDRAAMDEAIRSGDADLVYFVIFHLFKAMPLGEFFQVVSRTQAAGRLFERYCIDQNSPVLEDYYFQDDAFAKSAQLIVIENLGERDVPKLVANLKVALKILHNDRTRTLETTAIDTHIRLVQVQRQLEQELDAVLVGLPLNETLAQCLLKGNYARASKLRTEFKVPERRYYWIKLHALVLRRDWAELARLANAKKSPIGYRPFVDECIGALQYQEAAKYIPRCDSQERPQLFLRIGFFREAAQAAAATKDVDMLRQIHAASARDSTLQHDIAQQIEQFTRS
ncbi:Vacuolar protein [Coemansia sp. RSA 455]|nr:Vacuolar protein [Coemansia sp. S680]KAJ2053016.1 Vacuolar protein [Coemansia sp. S16]KAJ2089219.1 Vacuolar protein [Coemansia sp. S100]KAJ2110066.1 Vacuolar protein [Coemansia sp. S142-1]KAJ2115149.1 Vacuolar protein sorting-associated protein 16 [Coemansia sp. RSA 922]KAJ2258347.1 Vacuolar protein [Coemansia sp. RSA 455]